MAFETPFFPRELSQKWMTVCQVTIRATESRQLAWKRVKLLSISFLVIISFLENSIIDWNVWIFVKSWHSRKSFDIKVLHDIKRDFILFDKIKTTIIQLCICLTRFTFKQLTNPALKMFRYEIFLSGTCKKFFRRGMFFYKCQV